MLHLLVDFLSGIIRILAAACVIGGAAIGYTKAPDLQVEPWIGALIGFSAGFLAASLGGGLVACLILIENHLRVLADAQIERDRQPKTAKAESEQAEQSLPPPPPPYQPYRRQYSYQPPVPPGTEATPGDTATSAADQNETAKTEKKT